MLGIRKASGSSPGPRRRPFTFALVPLLAAGVAVAIVLATRSPSVPATGGPEQRGRRRDGAPPRPGADRH